MLKLASLLSAAAAEKAQYFVYIWFSSILQLINDISSDLQTLLRYFNGTAIVELSRIAFAPSASVFPNNLALYSKSLRSLL